jgi:hypothetical protein
LVLEYVQTVIFLRFKICPDGFEKKEGKQPVPATGPRFGSRQ